MFGRFFTTHICVRIDVKSITWMSENKIAVSYSVDTSDRMAIYDVSSRTMADFRDDPCSGGLVELETSSSVVLGPQYMVQYLSQW